ncbi:hypothetical protein A3Q56_03643, partial [Intoshia linei]
QLTYKLKKNDQENRYKTSTIIFLSIVGVIILIQLLATMVDIIMILLMKPKKPEKLENNEQYNQMLATYESKRSKFLLAFSLVNNLQRLFTIKSDKDKGFFECLSGLKAISILWIMYSHSYSYGVKFFGNVLALNDDRVLKYIGSFIFSSYLAVDSFLLFSGFLVGYGLLNKLYEKKSIFRINWFLYVILRLVRLLPLYYGTLCLYLYVVPYFTNGILVDHNRQIDEFCSGSVWKMFALFQNISDPATMCSGWLWYVHADIHLYLVAPIFLIAWFWNKKFGASFILITIIVEIMCILTYSIGDDLAIPIVYDIQRSMEILKMMNLIYFPTWTHFHSYLTGIVVSFIFIMCQRNEMNFRLSKIKIIIVWAVCLTIMAVIIITPTNLTRQPKNIYERSIYNSFVPLTWSICTGWVLFACISGYGGFINDFLSHNGFTVLGRITYATYLIHPIIYISTGFNMKNVYNYEFLSHNYIVMGQMLQQSKKKLPTHLAQKQNPWARLSQKETLQSIRRKHDYYDTQSPNDRIDFMLKSQYDQHRHFLKNNNEILFQKETLNMNHRLWVSFDETGHNCLYTINLNRRTLKNMIHTIEPEKPKLGHPLVNVMGDHQHRNINSIKNRIESHHNQQTRCGYGIKL